MNHVVTVFYALLGGWIWDRFGPGVLFATAAFMALANSAFALTVPKPMLGIRAEAQRGREIDENNRKVLK